MKVSRDQALPDGSGPIGNARSLLAGPDSGSPKLLVKFDVLPDVIYANLMPPVRRPQPHNVGLILTIANIGDTDYSGKSPDGALARFAILPGRTEIWKSPEVATDVVTPIPIAAGQAIRAKRELS